MPFIFFSQKKNQKTNDTWQLHWSPRYSWSSRQSLAVNEHAHEHETCSSTWTSTTKIFLKNYKMFFFHKKKHLIYLCLVVKTKQIQLYKIFTSIFSYIYNCQFANLTLYILSQFNLERKRKICFKIWTKTQTNNSFQNISWVYK